MLKVLKEIREKAREVVNSPESTEKEKELANQILAMDTAMVILYSARNNWLSSFAEHTGYNVEAKKTLKKEDDLIINALKSDKN